MRPIKLTMTALGPYANEQIIDFEEISHKNLFLITGPTGSGKTTIFDGISLAMYGETSGNIRSGESLRSHFAEESLITEVELEFQLKGKVYRIKRIPRQLKPKTRGEGYTEQKPEAELHYLTDEQPPVVGVKNVDEKIETLMGINGDQFRQIMMIPQGDFRKLLTSESTEREKVLKKLFDTQLFGLMQGKLDTMEKELKRGIETEIRLRTMELKKLALGDHPVTAQMKDVELFNVEDILKAADEYHESIEAQQTDLGKRIQGLNEAYTDQIKKHTQAKTDNENIEKRMQLKEQIDEKKLKKDKVEMAEGLVEKGNKALSVLPLEENRLHRQQDLAHREEALVKTKGQFDEAQARFLEAERFYQEETSEFRVNYRNELLIKRNKLGELSEKTVILQRLEGQLADESKKYDEMEQRAEKEKNRLETLKEEIENAEVQMTTYGEYQVMTDQLKNHIDALKHGKDDMLQLDIKLQNKTTWLRDHGILENRLSEGERMIEAATVRYKKMKIAFLNNQAALLAQDLEEGMPCPVCGATHHLRLAEMTEETIMEEALNKEESDLKKMETGYGRLKEQQAGLSEKIKIETDEIDRLLGRLKKWSTEVLDDIQHYFRSKIVDQFKVTPVALDYGLLDEMTTDEADGKACLTRLMASHDDFMATLQALSDDLIKTLGGADRLKAIVESKNESRDQLIKEMEKNAESSKVVEMAIVKIKTTLDGLKNEIPEAYRKADGLNLQMKALKDEMAQSKADLKTAEERFKQLTERLTYLRSQTEQMETDRVDAMKALEMAGEALRKRLLEQGFEDETAYLDAKRSPEALDGLRKKIEDYYRELNRMESQYDQLVQSTGDKAVQDLSTLKSAIDEMKATMDTLIEEKTQLSSMVAQNKKILQMVREITEKISASEERYRLLGRLAKVSKGENSKKITFERYILAAFLEDITNAANLRLRTMTGGRYYLSRTEDVERKNKQSGLELEVYDNYTGKIRHVKTLSGGESFKASLAMALGLSDVVQAYAGGVRLDTMFIDEGFGTLDPESLDHAINCLIDLQNTGRLVGIISHVPELKERIDTRLEVISTNSGSRAQFVMV